MSQAKQTSAVNFHHCENDGCTCPIHRDSDRDPFTAPLGMRFADEIRVRPITADCARRIYESHHSYMDGIPAVNVQHHGVYYQGNLVGALTYRFGLGGKRECRWGEDGTYLGRVHTEEDFQDLPKGIRQRARDVVDNVNPEEVAKREIVAGDKFLEVARICLGVQMPNLASAALARSQERIADNYCAGNDIQFLFTFVRSDFPGSMIRALKDKGWTCTGWARPSQASNRQEKQIRDQYKWRFVSPVENITEQATLGQILPQNETAIPLRP